MRKTPAHYECYLDDAGHHDHHRHKRGIISQLKSELFLGKSLSCPTSSLLPPAVNARAFTSSVLISILALIDGVEVEKSIAAGQMNNPAGIFELQLSISISCPADLCCWQPHPDHDFL